MKKNLLKILVFVAAVNLPFISVDTFYAEEREQMTFDKMIEENMDKNATDINKNLEKKLNAYGISDDDINDMPDSFIEKIEENNGNIDVDIKFYGCIAEDEEDNISTTQTENDEQIVEMDNLVELSDDEVDMIIAQSYSEDNADTSIGSELATGFMTNAYALGIEDEKEWKYDGIVEVYVCMSYGTVASNGTRTVETYAQAEWLKEPSKRGEDVLSISFQNDVVVDDSYSSGTYTYQNVDHSNPGILVKTNVKVPKSKLFVDGRMSSAYIKLNLVDDKSYAMAKKHLITLHTRGIVTNKSTQCVKAVATYWHKTTDISKTTSVDFTASSNGVGVTAYTTVSRGTRLKAMPNPAKSIIYFK